MAVNLSSIKDLPVSVRQDLHEARLEDGFGTHR